MKEAKNIEFSIKGILVTKFSLDLKEELIKMQAQEPNFNEYTFEVNVLNQGYIKENILNSMISMKVFLDKEKKTELGNISISNIFEINNLNEFVNEKENSLNLPDSFEASIIGISLSHTRAIFVTKCAGTFLQNAVMPILNPSEFLKINTDKKVNET
ncbi:MAG: hypothetical protein JST15_08535 [Bacteroidetes bacterium]|nr:hypothetical protein [Bacteroidota bacterium]